MLAGLSTVAIRPGKLDRSPTGTGCSARMAVLHAKTDPARHHEVLEQLRTVSLQTPTDTRESEGLLRHYEALSGAIDPQALIRRIQQSDVWVEPPAAQ